MDDRRIHTRVSLNVLSVTVYESIQIVECYHLKLCFGGLLHFHSRTAKYLGVEAADGGTLQSYDSVFHSDKYINH